MFKLGLFELIGKNKTGVKWFQKTVFCTVVNFLHQPTTPYITSMFIHITAVMEYDSAVLDIAFDGR